MNKDILFKTTDFVFSYRVAGILILNDKILLQRPKNTKGFALPGGHVSFGETSTESLIREFKEEVNVDIKVNDLLLVGEVFFNWADKPCQQIGLYYKVSLCDESQIQLDGTFDSFDEVDNSQINLEFCWIPLSELNNVLVYPENIKNDLINLPNKVKYFISNEI